MAAPAEGDRGLVGVQGKCVSLGIGQRKRTFDDKRTIGTHANLDTGHEGGPWVRGSKSELWFQDRVKGKGEMRKGEKENSGEPEDVSPRRGKGGRSLSRKRLGNRNSKHASCFSLLFAGAQQKEDPRLLVGCGVGFREFVFGFTLIEGLIR